MHRVCYFSVLMSAVLLVGCTETPTSRTITRDSAGVAIIESRTPEWEGESRWVVDTAGALQLEGGGDLYQVRGVYKLLSGQILVANSSEPAVLIYGPDGRFLKKFGQKGRGPGEFLEITRMHVVRGDTVVIYDYLLSRVSYFDADGRFARSWSTAGVTNAGQAVVDGAFQDGAVLLITIQPASSGASGVVRDQRTLWRYDGFASPTEVARISGPEIFYQRAPDGAVDFRPPFFGHGTYYVAHGDRLLYAPTDTFVIREFDWRSGSRRIMRILQPPTPVDRKDIDYLIGKRLDEVKNPEHRPLVKQLLKNMPADGIQPFFGLPSWASSSLGPAMHVDPEGNLWLMAHWPPQEIRRRRIVISANGRWLGSVEFPPKFAVKQIGHDFVAGVQYDESDVENVVVYRLRRE